MRLPLTATLAYALQLHFTKGKALLCQEYNFCHILVLYINANACNTAPCWHKCIANSGRSDFPFQWVSKNTDQSRWRLSDLERPVFSRRPWSDPSIRNRRFKPLRCTIEVAYIFASVKAVTVVSCLGKHNTPSTSPLELTSKVTTEFAYNGTSRGCIKNVIAELTLLYKRTEMHVKDAIGTEQNVTL